eukprot:403334563
MTKHALIEPIMRDLVLCRQIFVAFSRNGTVNVQINNKCNENDNKCELNPNQFELVSDKINKKTYMGGAETFKVVQMECYKIL